MPATPLPAHSSPRKSSPILIAVAWLIVLIPTVWGLTYTVRNAMKLFQSPPAAAASAVPNSGAK